MKKTTFLLVFLLCVFTAFTNVKIQPSNLNSKSSETFDAPVTSCGSILNAQIGSVVSVPVYVANTSNLGNFKLKLNYNPEKITYNSVDQNVILLTVAVTMVISNNPVNDTLSYIMADVNNNPNFTFTDSVVLFNLNFTVNAAPAYISFDNTSANGSQCEYANATGDVVNDVPTENFYFNGTINTSNLSPSFATSNMLQNILSF